MYREWRRAGHGDDGHDHACRRRAGEFSRHWRRRLSGARGRRVSSRALRSARALRARQHLRGHQSLRLGGAGNHPGGEGRERTRADRRAARGDERRAGARDSARQRTLASSPRRRSPTPPRRRWRRSTSTPALARRSPGRRSHEHSRRRDRRASSSRDSRATRRASTRRRRSSTARRSSAASRPGKAARRHLGLPGVRHREGGGAGDGRDGERHLRSRAVLCATRSWRRRTRGCSSSSASPTAFRRRT